MTKSVLITVPDSMLPGVEHALAQYNAAIPATVPGEPDEEGNATDVPNPALIGTVEGYLTHVMSRAIESYNANMPAASAPAPAPAPSEPLDGVPQEVTRRQARQALILAGKLDLVQPAIDAIKDPIQKAIMQSEWDDSQTFLRTRPALVAMARAIGLDDAGIDALFVAAAKL